MEISIPAIVRVKPKAIYKIGKYLRKDNLKNIAIFFGEGIKELFYETILISLQSSEIKVIYQDVVCDNDINKVFDTTFRIPQTVEAIVAIGGGKVIDYCKYMGFIAHKPVISVPTSISNDGFCSPMSSLVVNNKRKSIKAKIPFGVIVDTEIIRNSPRRYSFSGIGDLLSNITAIHDWKLYSKKFDIAANDFAILISNNAVENFIHHLNKNITDLECLKHIVSSLIMNGISMEISHSSRPSSGSEHLISHAYDSVSEKPSLHGLQVGVATYCISWLQDNPLHQTIINVMNETGFTTFMSKNKLNKNEFIKAIDLAPTIKENFYTVLSEKNALNKLKEFVSTDEYCKNFLE